MSLTVGDKFQSFALWEEAVKKYELENYIQLWRRDARTSTIQTAKKRLSSTTDRQFNEDLQYYELKYCIPVKSPVFNRSLLFFGLHFTCLLFFSCFFLVSCFSPVFLENQSKATIISCFSSSSAQIYLNSYSLACINMVMLKLICCYYVHLFTAELRVLALH